MIAAVLVINLTTFAFLVDSSDFARLVSSSTSADQELEQVQESVHERVLTETAKP